MEESEKATEGLLKVFGHLMGLRTEPDGTLVPTEGWQWEEGEENGNVNLDNVNTTAALNWEAGSLLNTVSDFNITSADKVGNIRSEIEKLTIPKSGPPVIPPFKPVKPVVEQDPFAATKSGFLPPRRVPGGEETKKFTFAKPKAEEEVASVSKSFWSEPPPKKAAVGTGLWPRPAEPTGNPVHKPYQNPLVIEPTSNSEEEEPSPFRTAYDILLDRDKKKGIQRNLPPPAPVTGPGRRLGLGRPPPGRTDPPPPPPKRKSDENTSENPEIEELMSHELMKNIDAKMVEAILNEVIQVNPTTWEDIAGLNTVKKIIREIIIWPMERPDIFVGLRAAPKGILFFGPPGTGKTMFGRVIATESRSTFFNISASSLTSKWIGDGEKMVRALFAVARVKAPSVIFIDEIDSILTARSDSEHESSRRMKTEFLLQFDGCGTSNEERILVIGVTNRPQELDDAARRRLVKRIYIPLPDFEARKQLIKHLVKNYDCSMSEADFEKIAKFTEGYSGADMNSLCREAAMGPLRDVNTDIQNIDAANIRPISIRDFGRASRQVKSSVDPDDVKMYEDWDVKFGCHTGPTPGSADESFEFMTQD